MNQYFLKHAPRIIANNKGKLKDTDEFSDLFNEGKVSNGDYYEIGDLIYICLDGKVLYCNNLNLINKFNKDKLRYMLKPTANKQLK